MSFKVWMHTNTHKGVVQTILALQRLRLEDHAEGYIVNSGGRGPMERVLRGEEHWLLIYRIRVQFPAPHGYSQL